MEQELRKKLEEEYKKKFEQERADMEKKKQ